MCRRRLPTVIAVLLVGVMLAACSGSGKPSQPSPSTRGSGTSTYTPSSNAPSSDLPSSSSPSSGQTTSAIEAIIERSWANYWKVTLSLEGVPEAARPAMVHRIAVDPIYGQLINAVRAQADDGYVGYGVVRTRPTWPASPVVTANSKSAVMNDCFDGSHAGLRVKRTGVIHTRGTPRTNVKVTFARGRDKVWRVRQIEYLKPSC